VKNGVWMKTPGRALNECVLGIVGLGNIGTAVAKRARAFGMEMLANDIRRIEPEVVAEAGVEMLSLEDLLGQSDFVSLNCDLNPTSRHLMNQRTFALMKDGAVIINLARGPIIEEGSLIEALESGKIGGAALDVFEHEPLPVDSPLKAMPNVMLAPHNSNSSSTAWLNVHENTIRNLFDVLEAES
jgi:D-3-phosphoglycerate dehydrogenase